MKRFNREKIAIILILLFVIAAVLFMFGGNFFSHSETKKEPERDYTVMPDANSVTDEITNGVKVEQNFVSSVDSISEIAIVFSRLYYVEDVELVIELLDGNEIIAENTYKVEEIEDQHRTFLTPASPISGIINKELKLRIYSADKSDTGLAIMMNDSTGKVFSFDKKNVKGTLCFSISE